MSLLVVQLPPRLRQHPALPAQSGVTTPDSAIYGYVYSSNGVLTDQGQCAAALLPQATSTVAVLAETDLSWHRMTCPRAAPARMRAALLGVLEEQLLGESEGTHLSLEPGAVPGESVWVAATDHAWLASQIETLERAGCAVDRVVPPIWPGDIPRGHFSHDPDNPADAMLLTWASSGGVASWPLKGSLARSLLPDRLPANSLFSASPAVASAAERWLGQPVHVVSAAERLLKLAESRWNLRQFDLTPRHRTAALMRDALREFGTATWRPVRLGLIGLALVHLVGLNAYAWMLDHRIQQQRRAQIELLQQAHPQVRAVIDAPVQMRRENEALLAAAGRAGNQDLETMLGTVASAWPDQVPIQSLKYDGNQLQLVAPGLNEARIGQIAQTLRPAGWQVEGQGTQLTLKRSAAGSPAGGNR